MVHYHDYEKYKILVKFYVQDTQVFAKPSGTRKQTLWFCQSSLH